MLLIMLKPSLWLFGRSMRTFLMTTIYTDALFQQIHRLKNSGNIKNRLPSETTHAILQLHFILTRTHSILFNFLDEGGLPMLPPLPTSSPFSAFDNVAATIIRYIPEVPHLVQRSPKKLVLVWRLVAAKRSWSQRMWVRLLICQCVGYGENFIKSWPTYLIWRES